jgi:group II intron reverse transcriptase/maturase
MQKAETVLSAIQKRGAERKPLERLYRQLYNPEMYLRAYANLYANKGAMTPGTTNQTVDGMSQARINRLIEHIRNETYRWTPVQRTYIPKKDGTKRPLGMPTWEDKMLQEVIRMMLEAYYEPRFSDHSHGFRPKRGCHTALEAIKYESRGTTWFIEGDLSKCFDRINHGKLVEILRRDIHDERFIRLIQRLLTAGYLEDWKWHETLSGTPQGGVVSPILSNIYLHELDEFVENELIPAYTRGKRRRRNPLYRHYGYKMQQAKSRNDRKAYKAYNRKMRTVPTQDTHDPGYRRLRYVRYADDFLLTLAGPKTEAEAIKQQLATWLSTELSMELSQTKTLVTHASTGAARFLGYDIRVGRNDNWRDSDGKRNLNGEIILQLPVDRLNSFIARYTQAGKPIHKGELIHNSDFDIVARYQSEYRGYVQFYKLAVNLHQMNKLRWVMETSMLKTLANKHKSTVQKMANKYGCTLETPEGPMKGFRISVERTGKKPLVAVFGGIPLRYCKRTSSITDKVVTIGTNTSELVQRLTADQCEMCGSKQDVEVHHVRKLADLKVKGRKERPIWVKRMAALRRKTLVVCKTCHQAIHAGQTRAIWNDKLESRVQ